MSAVSHVKTSMTVMNKLIRSEHNTAASPFNISVSFVGVLPPGIPTSKIPVEVVFILPEAYASYIRPVMQVIPTAVGGPPSDGERSSSDSELYATFLPLPSTFNHHDAGCWEALAAEIQSWVLDVAVDVNSAERTWGTDAFWMAYCAAYPTFPQGTWAAWNPHMRIVGTFGERWLMGAEHRNKQHEDNCDGDCRDCMQIRDDIWSEFQAFVRLFYTDGPIIRAE